MASEGGAAGGVLVLNDAYSNDDAAAGTGDAADYGALDGARHTYESTSVAMAPNARPNAKGGGGGKSKAKGRGKGGRPAAGRPARANTAEEGGDADTYEVMNVSARRSMGELGTPQVLSNQPFRA